MGWKWGGVSRRLVFGCIACIHLCRGIARVAYLQWCRCIACSTYIDLYKCISCSACMNISPGTAILRFLQSLNTIHTSTKLCGNCLVLHRAGDYVSFSGSFQCPCTTVSLVSSSGTIMHLPLHISDVRTYGIHHQIGLFRILLVGNFIIICSRNSFEL